nr:fibronectin type III domain-containing protein [Lachnospiraceae bacterium]
MRKTQRMKIAVASFLLTALLLSGAAAESFEEAIFFTPGDSSGEEVFFEESFSGFEDGFFIGDTIPEESQSAAGVETEMAESKDEETGESEEADYLEARSVLMLPTELTLKAAKDWQAAPMFLSAESTKNSTVVLTWTPALKKLPKGVKYYVYDIDEKTGAALQIGKPTNGKKMTLKNVPRGQHVFAVRAEIVDSTMNAENYGVLSYAPAVTVNSVLWADKPKVTAAQLGTTI